MRRTFLGLVVAVLLVDGAFASRQSTVSGQQSPAPAVQQSSARPGAAVQHRAVLDRYCVGCHNDRLLTGSLSLQALDLSSVEQNADVWERVVRKVSAGAMPPVGQARPDAQTTQNLVTYLSGTLDREAAARPKPGRPALHRLNRAEYANVIRDLLALDVDVASLLPADELSHGFDNIGDALGVSPVLLERYLSAADKISALAVGDPDVGPGSDTYVARGDSHQLDHLEGLPLGTRGGLIVRRNFPLDGDYIFSAKLWRTNNGFIRGLSAAHQVEFSVDGERVFLTSVGGQADWQELLSNPASADTFDARLQARVHVKAGPHVVGITFVEKTAARNQTLYRPLLGNPDSVDSDGVPRIDTAMVAGPFNATGPGDTPSRRRIFTCRPASARSGVASPDETACATTIVSTLARRAFRRPVTAAETRRLMAFYETGRKNRGTFDGGAQLALRRILADPAFLYRAERDPARVPAGSVYRVSDLELASRLSFFLWSSIPDDELLRVAEQKRLSSPTVYRQQVRRMLADAKADALVANFAGQWLQLRNLQRVVPDPMEFPDFDDNLRQAFRRETELFVGSIMREDRSVLDLLRADFTYVNERLARHYGIAGVNGTNFRRVAVTSDARRGLLGQGSVLTLTSHSNRTSPVKRGKWILENLLGSPPPSPPPNVPPFNESQDSLKPKTMKERMVEHRANPVCANCHRLMDPLGLALENFDGVGAWRVRDTGVRIDATSQLLDGTNVDGAVSLRQALLQRPEVFVRTFTENLTTYALGRGLTADDMPVVRSIMREAAPQEYRFQSIVMALVNSPPFQMRMKASAEEE
ncbi:MAG: DUF1592 domain-containing protein [Vicinamibacterales bacterium]